MNGTPNPPGDVPPDVLRTASFQAWADAIALAGNELRSARMEWAFRIGARKDTVFCWAVRPAIHVRAEGRTKTNEVVFSRPDLAAVLAYYPGEQLTDTEIVLIREFRSAGATSDGFVHELPGGSDSAGTGDLRAVAAREFTEETGRPLDPARLRPHHSRQLAATFSTHRMHLFSVQLTRPELEAIRADTQAHGDRESTEITYTEVRTYGDLISGGDVDWTTLGAIAQVLADLQVSRTSG